ncbi:MAG: type II toxin-antitoxin system prevent-host-death family antitoxin [Candidatus Dormiibacterota bacterium]
MNVSIRELRNHGGDVIARVEAGERRTVTRDGEPVASLQPVRRQALAASVLLEHWRHLPVVDLERLRADLDTIIDSRR